MKAIHVFDAFSAPGFNGELHEPGTGWQILGNGYRVYNPVLMRFHGPDNLSPFGKGGLNVYAYCAGDPVNRVDPTGHVTLRRLSSLFAVPMSNSERALTFPAAYTTTQSSLPEALTTLTRRDKSAFDSIFRFVEDSAQRQRRELKSFGEGIAGLQRRGLEETMVNKGIYRKYVEEIELTEELARHASAAKRDVDFARRKVGKRVITETARQQLHTYAATTELLMWARSVNGVESSSAVRKVITVTTDAVILIRG